jgi:dolichyl-phosphate-mannose--protein O-mannosyl transferase
MGIGAIIITVYDFLLTFKKSKQPHHQIQAGPKSTKLIFTDRDRFVVVLLGFFVFWLPWIFSPRIMFLYHYSPSIPFLCLSLGYQIDLMVRSQKSRIVGLVILGLIFAGFLIVYPMLTGIPLAKEIFTKFFDLNLTKNPFGQ